MIPVADISVKMPYFQHVDGDSPTDGLLERIQHSQIREETMTIEFIDQAALTLQPDPALQSMLLAAPVVEGEALTLDAYEQSGDEIFLHEAPDDELIFDEPAQNNYDPREVNGEDGQSDGTIYMPYGGDSSSNAVYVSEEHGSRETIREKVGKFILEWFAERGLDLIVGTPAPGTEVTFERGPSTSQHTSNEIGLSKYYANVSEGSISIKQSDRVHSTLIVAANGFDSTNVVSIDRDGDNGADVLYMQKSDGSWWKAESVSATGEPQWVRSDSPEEEGDIPRDQEG